MTTAEKILNENLVRRKTEELSYIVEDWKKIEYIPLKQQAAKEILARARELVAAADECEEKPQKSEMPCNCKQGKTLQDIIDEAKAELTDSKTYAAIVFRVD